MPKLVDYLRWLRMRLKSIPGEVQAFHNRREWWAKGVLIEPHVVIELGENAQLEIGKGTSIEDYTILILGDDPKAAVPAPSSLQIGEQTSIGKFNNLRAGGGAITIGSHCFISQFVSIIASNHSTSREKRIMEQPWDTARTGVRICDDVWIGVNSVILPGVTLGEGCVIAAGSVVTEDIPPYAVAAGVPARVLRYR